jgi:hypothetical protein
VYFSGQIDQVGHDWPLSQPLFSESSGEVIAVITWGEQSGCHDMMTSSPGCSLIIGNYPHLEGWSILQVSTVPQGKFQSLIIKMLSIIPVLFDSNMAAGENDSDQRTTGTKWRQSCQPFLLLLVNLWAWVRSQCFWAKAVSAPLINAPHNQHSDKTLPTSPASPEPCFVLLFSHYLYSSAYIKDNHCPDF